MHNFKKMLKTSILFLLIVAIMCTALMEVFFAGENYYYQDGRERTEAAGTINFAIIGASRSKRGISTEILDEELGVNSYNYSGSVMTMWARYEALMKEADRNPIDTLILELSTDSVRDLQRKFDREGDYYNMGTLSSFTERLEFAFKYLKPSEYTDALCFFMNNGIDCAKRALKGNYHMTNILSGNLTGAKGYTAFIDSEDQTRKFNYKKKYKTEGIEQVVSETKVEYLEKIVAECKERGIRLILVTVPVSKRHICTQKGFDFWSEWYTNFANENGLEYYNFDLYKERDVLFSDVDCFMDKSHLNITGSQIFSLLLTKTLKEVDAGEDVSDLFFESYDAYERTQDYYPKDKK